MDEKEILVLEKMINKQIMNNVKNVGDSITLLKHIHKLESLSGKKGKELRDRFFASHKKSINTLDKEILNFIKNLLN